MERICYLAIAIYFAFANQCVSILDMSELQMERATFEKF